jgi:hypothetical protein
MEVGEELVPENKQEEEAAGDVSDTTYYATEEHDATEAGDAYDTEESSGTEEQGLLGLDLERQGRALATTGGCQGTEPGHKEDRSEGDGVKLKAEGNEYKSEGWREGTEDPQKWQKQGRRRKK